MLLVKTYLAESKVHGIGLFAAESIKKGTVIWEFSPHIDMVFPVMKYEEAPRQVKDFLKVYGYVSIDRPDVYTICVDNARFINHSEEPNTDDTTGLTIAKRDIAAGEEILSNYAEFEAPCDREFYVGDKAPFVSFGKESFIASS